MAALKKQEHYREGHMARYRPGESGNPKGRPKGSRNKLGEEFIAAFHQDFMLNGIDAIERCRSEAPWQYLNLILRILPKIIESSYQVEHLSDEELDKRLEQLLNKAKGVHK